MTNKKTDFSLSIVIPIYNNEKSLKRELESIEEFVKSFTKQYEIVITDDKSTDDSKAILKSFEKRKGFRVYFNKQNLGIAGNLKKLYSLARLEYVLLYSVDGDWNYKDIYVLSEKAFTSKADIVIGNRLSKTGYSTYRRMITGLYNLFPIVLFGVDTIDAGSIKVFKRKVYRKMKIRSESVFADAEFIIKASKKKYIIESVTVHYSKRDFDKKSSISLTLVKESFIDMLRMRLKG